MSPISLYSNNTSSLFKKRWVDTNEMGLPFFPQHNILGEHEIVDIIQGLYGQMHNNTSSSFCINHKIDKYWLALFLCSVGSDIVQNMSWRCFVLRDRDVFAVHHLPDIGNVIRKLSLYRNISDDVMCRIIQYSLPYVKHNRLNFPRFKDIPPDTLLNLIRITFGTLLSIYPHCQKQALWQLRFKIYVYMYTLISKGSQHDHYLFCLSNINLLRIALIEYFVYFVQTQMPCELQILHTLFGASNNVAGIFRQFLVNIEQFRAQNLQNTTLCWANMHQKSHYIIERCNRLCKGKPKIPYAILKNHSFNTNFDIEKLLLCPKFTHPMFYKLFDPSLSFDQIRYIEYVHRHIHIFELPLSIWKLQVSHLRRMLCVETQLYSTCMYLYICFRCIHKQGNIIQNMRLNSKGEKQCNLCQQSDAIISFNSLGRIISIFDKKFYFCLQCFAVHEWQATAQEFFQCNLKRTSLEISKNMCLICKRMLNLSSVSILDNRLGIMHTVTLCTRHQPREYEMPYMHTLQALVQCIKQKQTFRYKL